MTPGTRQLIYPTGQTYLFDAGSFAIELLLTGGPGPYARYEILHEPEDLQQWLINSRLTLLSPLELDDVKINASELRKIKHFRDTLWRVASAILDGQTPDLADIDVINDAAATPPTLYLDQDRQRQWNVPVTGRHALGAAANEAIEILGTERITRLRRCQGANCNLVFYDTSRPSNRRWCSMQRCGNRHKIKAYRSRAKS